MGVPLAAGSRSDIMNRMGGGGGRRDVTPSWGGAGVLGTIAAGIASSSSVVAGAVGPDRAKSLRPPPELDTARSFFAKRLMSSRCAHPRNGAGRSSVIMTEGAAGC